MADEATEAQRAQRSTEDARRDAFVSRLTKPPDDEERRGDLDVAQASSVSLCLPGVVGGLTNMAARLVLGVLLVAALFGPAPGAASTGPSSPQAASPAGGAPGEDDPLEEFVPREKVPADSAVAFPVDI
jgi:hypothetical protein